MAIYLATALLALVGERVPSITLDQGWGPPSKIDLAERVKGKSSSVGAAGCLHPNLIHARDPRVP